HYYWLTVPYFADGSYKTADYAGTAALGTYTVTNFAPAFNVNGSGAGPVATVVGQALTVLNASQRGATVTAAGGYYYSFCAIPCSVDNYVLWGTMGDAPPSGAPPTTATIPNPGVGSWLLKIKVNYVNPAGTAYWPDPAGAIGVVVNVSNCANPEYHIVVGGAASYPRDGLSVQAGQAVTFVPDNAYPATFSWNFGDGSALDTTQNPTHTFSSAGNYTVTFTAAGGACSISHPIAVAGVNPLSVVASVNPNPQPVNVGATFSCAASGGAGGYTYTWSGAFSSTQQSTFQTFPSAGSYTATCIARDANSASAGASVPFTVNASGGGGCTNADFHLSDGSYANPGFSVATGTAVTFVPNNVYNTYAWSFGDGGSDSAQSPTHTYTNAGTYTVSLTANGNCTRSYQMVVTGPGGSGPGATCTTVDFSIRDSSDSSPLCGQFGCNGITGRALSFIPSVSMTQPVTSWNFGDGSPNTATNPGTHTYLNGGTYNVVLTAGTCTKTYELTIAGPSVLSGAFIAKYTDGSSLVPTQIASGKSMSFLATDTADLYTWDFGDGTSPVTGQTPVHTFVEPFLVNRTVTLSVSRTGTPATSASTAQVFTIIPPPEPPKWFVAGMAYTQGAVSGTVWQSEVTVFNPDPTRPATYSVAFLDGRNPVSPSSLDWKTLTIGARKSLSSTNVLGGFFGQPLGSYGALLVRGDSAPVPPVITARTFNSGDAAKGTFGLSVPPTQPTSGVSQQSLAAQQLLIGLRDDATAYTNIGLVNLISTDWSHAHLTFFDAAGVNLGVINVDVPPYGVAQLSKPLTSGGWLGKPPTSLFRVRVTVDPGGAVYPYATVIDQASTDPIVVTPTEQPLNSYRVPGILRATGANGEHWRSRFTVANPSGAGARKVHMVFSYVACDDVSGCGSLVSIPGDVILNPGQTQSWDDFVKVWLTAKGHIGVDDVTRYQNSFLDISPADSNSDPLVVLGETYNDTPNGHIGLQVPGYTPLDGASRTGANKRLVLTGLESSAAYRSNLAIFVVAGAAGKSCTAHVYAPTGELLRDIFVPVDGFSQVNNGALFGAGDPPVVSVVIDNIEDGVTLAGYATIIDNTSGDATFVKAQPAP
ncbi:MAG: PKD domain-containing protein, partial [Acidobacteriota bacterium]|nr:PKD domain-containing protein [Acidobacteriota bacterium]